MAPGQRVAAVAAVWVSRFFVSVNHGKNDLVVVAYGGIIKHSCSLWLQ